MHESLWLEGRCLLGREKKNSPSAMTMVHKLSTGHSALGTDEAVLMKIVSLNTHTHTHTEAVLRKRDLLLLLSIQPELGLPW